MKDGWGVSIFLLALVGPVSMGSTAAPVLLGQETRSGFVAKQPRPSDGEMAPAPRPLVEKGTVARHEGGLFTAQKEAAALAFVEQHHAELRELLTVLKQAHKQKYRQAILEIYRVSERLSRMEEKAPARYALELEVWKNNSRLNLLIASLPMTSDPEATLQQIKVLLEEKYSLELQQVTYEIEMARKRLERLEQTSTRLRTQQHEAIDRQLERLSRVYQPAESPEKQQVPTERLRQRTESGTSN